MIKPKPCPFCNKEAKLLPYEKSKSNESYFSIGCETEGCYMQEGSGWEFHENDTEFHIKLWNKRSNELPNKSLRRFYSLKELGEILGINYHSIYALVERNTFPFKPVKIGAKSIRFFCSDVDEYINNLKRNK
jgi:predicted DNA-binding transcriptional regulator AlpA